MLQFFSGQNGDQRTSAESNIYTGKVMTDYSTSNGCKQIGTDFSFAWDQSTCQERFGSDKIQNEKSHSGTRTHNPVI